MKNSNRKIQIIIVLTITFFFIISSFTTTGNDYEGNSDFFSGKTKEIINKREIAIPDTDIYLYLWDELIDYRNIVHYYGISLDGKRFNRITEASYELGLRYAQFDPLIWVPHVESSLAANGDTHLFIVQFYTQPLKEFKETIELLGGKVHHYIAQYAYLVEMDEMVHVQVNKLPYIRWIGPYHPAYRLEEYILDNFHRAEKAYPFQCYNIQVLTINQKDLVTTRIKEIGGIVNNANQGKFLIRATLTPEQLFEVIKWDEILFIDRWTPYEIDMDIAREIGGADYIESIAGYNGSGVRGEIFDGGFNLNHVDFASRPLIQHGIVGNHSHGASTSGICFGDGTGNTQARGLLPKGQGIVADFNYVGMTGSSRYNHTGELINDPYNAVFQSASCGSTHTTHYSTISADTDAALFDFDIVHCQSQGNEGDQMSRPQAWAKNIISVGGINHFNTLDRSDDWWGFDASIGPASDGRIKPTFAHFYDWILTVGYPGPTDYTTGFGFGGTSAATSIIAGHVGLFFLMWSDGIFGNDVDPNGTIFENRAHMTTAKAMLINTAYQYPFNGTGVDKARMHQGWGMPNLKTLYDLREDFYIVDETDILEPFDVGRHFVSVNSNESFFKVTMTYSDPPGNPAVQTQHRINDLTLKVTSPTGVEYWGNNGLHKGIWSTPNGDSDSKNTVECVFIKNPDPGAWMIEIYSDEIIEDSHIETSELDADYALVISPILGGPYPPEIDGPKEGKLGLQYDYSVVTTDPADKDIYYWIDWGDGSETGWIGPYKSGKKIMVNHTWEDKNLYSIRAKAKDIFGNESAWSTFEVTMPKNKPIFFNFPILNWLFERFPNVFPMLRLLLGLI